MQITVLLFSLLLLKGRVNSVGVPLIMSLSDPAKQYLVLCLAAIQPRGAGIAGSFCSEGDVAPWEEEILESS